MSCKKKKEKKKSPDPAHIRSLDDHNLSHLLPFKEPGFLLFLLIYSIGRSLWFTLTLREGRNGGQHVPGRRYVYQSGSFIRHKPFAVSRRREFRAASSCLLFASKSDIRLCRTSRGALNWAGEVSISKYLGFKMGQASRLSWPRQLAASLLNS